MESHFDNAFYDNIVGKIYELFPQAEIEVKSDKGTITIKDKINLMLSVSFNEPKIYFNSFIFLPRSDVEKEIYFNMGKANYCFRLFATEEIIKYLELKQQENEFIRANEG